MKPIKILFISGWLWPWAKGGPSVVLLNLVKKLALNPQFDLTVCGVIPWAERGKLYSYYPKNVKFIIMPTFWGADGLFDTLSSQVVYALKILLTRDQYNIVHFNDVDTKIHNIDLALHCIKTRADMVYCRVSVSEGPQVSFYRILNPIRQRVHICASGEFMLVKRHVFDKVMPVPPCIAEDSYILFKALELGFTAYFCTESYVTTKRTSNNKDEEAYKARTTLGIYQALNYSKPSLTIRVFYYLLPAFSPLLMLAGDSGVAWARGIRKAVKENLAKQDITKF